MFRQTGHIVVQGHEQIKSDSVFIIFMIAITIMIIIIFLLIIINIIVVIKSAFIYHLRFVVLSILHHRDKEQRTEKGEKNKKMTQIIFFTVLLLAVLKTKATFQF